VGPTISRPTDAPADNQPPELSPATQALLAAWQQAGHAVQAQAVVGPAFWQLYETPDSHALRTSTLQILRQTLDDKEKSSRPSWQDAKGGQPAQGDASLDALQRTSLGPLALHEEAIAITCGGAQMLGVVAQAAMPHHPPSVAARSQHSMPSDLGFIVIVGGPQYRVGSHRQFLLLARRAAQAGFASLRFDLRGMGDSEGVFPGFEALDDDIAAAIAALQQRAPTVRRVLLFGLCDGASAAMLYWARQRDPRVAGLCLLNPWARSEATLAQTRIKHYYQDRLRSAAFWKKLLLGRVSLRSSISEIFQDLMSMNSPQSASKSIVKSDLKNTNFLDLQQNALSQFSGPIALLLSGQDYTAKEFLTWAQGAGLALPGPGFGARIALRADAAAPHITRFDFPDADHTFASAAWRTQLEDAVLAWMQQATATIPA
jgi:uncharacterized protein